MKTWEVIKELTKNPNKKFTYKEAQDGSYITVEDGLIVWRGDFQRGQSALMGYVGEKDYDWEEVKEPLSFIEVLEVVKDRSYAYVTLENQKHRITFEEDSLDVILSELSASWESGEIADILLNSKFYISD